MKEISSARLSLCFLSLMMERVTSSLSSVVLMMMHSPSLRLAKMTPFGHTLSLKYAAPAE